MSGTKICPRKLSVLLELDRRRVSIASWQHLRVLAAATTHYFRLSVRRQIVNHRNVFRNAFPGTSVSRTRKSSSSRCSGNSRTRLISERSSRCPRRYRTLPYAHVILMVAWSSPCLRGGGYGSIWDIRVCCCTCVCCTCVSVMGFGIHGYGMR